MKRLITLCGIFLPGLLMGAGSYSTKLSKIGAPHTPHVGARAAGNAGKGGVALLAAHRVTPEVRAGDGTPSGTIGSVDMEEVYNASGAPQELDQAGRQHEADGIQRINKIMSVPFLEPAELEEYGTLIGKLKMTPEEEKRAAALKTISDQRAAELRTLETKANGALTAEEKIRVGHLTDLRVTLQNQVRPGLVADFRTQHDGWLSDYRHHQIVALRQEVAKVAKEKHIDHVFDSGTLVFSMNDLTPTVLQRVAKRNGRH